MSVNECCSVFLSLRIIQFNLKRFRRFSSNKVFRECRDTRNMSRNVSQCVPCIANYRTFGRGDNIGILQGIWVIKYTRPTGRAAAAVLQQRVFLDIGAQLSSNRVEFARSAAAAAARAAHAQIVADDDAINYCYATLHRILYWPLLRVLPTRTDAK